MKFFISALILVTQSFKVGHQVKHPYTGKENIKTGMKVNRDVGDYSDVGDILFSEILC